MLVQIRYIDRGGGYKMYALLALFFISFVWLAFISKIFINSRRENEIKRNNQAYYNKKILKLKDQMYGERGLRKTEETKRSGRSKA